MSTSPVATNQQVDAAVLSIIKKAAGTGIKSLAIGGRLLRTHLPLKKLPGALVGREGWNSQEHANRSCQRLRKKGLVAFDSKRGWLPATD